MSNATDGSNGVPLIQCDEIQRVVWSDGPESAPVSHLEDCSACRDEAGRAADLRAALSGMANRFAVVPEDLEAALIAAISRSRLDRARQIMTHPKFWRGAAVGAAAAATAAIGLIVVRRNTARPEVA